MSDQETDGDLAALEAALGSLQPVEPTLDHYELMFQAGVNSTRRHQAARSWFWPLATAAMALIAVTLATSLALRPESRVVERVVYVPRAVERDVPAGARDQAARPIPDRVASGALRPISPHSYLQLRQVVLARGVDALPDLGDSSPARTQGAPSGVRNRELLDKLLGV